MCVKLSQVVSTTATANVSTFFIVNDISTDVYEKFTFEKRQFDERMNPHLHDHKKIVVLHFCLYAELREAVLTTFVYNNVARNQKEIETTIKNTYQKRNKKRKYQKSTCHQNVITLLSAASNSKRVVAARTGAAMQLITDRSICDTQHLECGVSLESTEDEYTGKSVKQVSQISTEYER
ncbi:conserved hypothetical protein [Trichinella spiralis]|uniref:hypothetical protein n=1 Tax=Trichinella spiralis TaxID=6334 RepID=UPI0001EFB552|nr:conserved hypothetical protein [Trichinella spiralis]